MRLKRIQWDTDVNRLEGVISLMELALGNPADAHSRIWGCVNLLHRCMTLIPLDLTLRENARLPARRFYTRFMQMMAVLLAHSPDDPKDVINGFMRK